MLCSDCKWYDNSVEACIEDDICPMQMYENGRTDLANELLTFLKTLVEDCNGNDNTHFSYYELKEIINKLEWGN